MTNDVKYIFMCLLVICVSSLEKCLSIQTFCPFLKWSVSVLFCLCPLKNIYLFRERVQVGERGRERERDRERQRETERERESQVGSTLIMEPNMGLNLTTVRSWPEPKSRVGHSTDWATQVPLVFVFIVKFSCILDKSPSSDTWFADYFFPSCVLSFTLLQNFF